MKNVEHRCGNCNEKLATWHRYDGKVVVRPWDSHGGNNCKCVKASHVDELNILDFDNITQKKRGKRSLP